MHRDDARRTVPHAVRAPQLAVRDAGCTGQRSHATRVARGVAPALAVRDLQKLSRPAGSPHPASEKRYQHPDPSGGTSRFGEEGGNEWGAVAETPQYDAVDPFVPIPVPVRRLHTIYDGVNIVVRSLRNGDFETRAPVLIESLCGAICVRATATVFSLSLSRALSLNVRCSAPPTQPQQRSAAPVLPSYPRPPIPQEPFQLQQRALRPPTSASPHHRISPAAIPRPWGR